MGPSMTDQTSSTDRFSHDAGILAQALPYMQRYEGKTVVVKLKVSAANTKAIARLRKVKSVVSAKSKAGVVRKANTTLVGKKKKK